MRAGLHHVLPRLRWPVRSSYNGRARAIFHGMLRCEWEEMQGKAEITGLSQAGVSHGVQQWTEA